jgi:small subunit ribosomal protein S17
MPRKKKDENEEAVAEGVETPETPETIEAAPAEEGAAMEGSASLDDASADNAGETAAADTAADEISAVAPDENAVAAEDAGAAPEESAVAAEEAAPAAQPVAEPLEAPKRPRKATPAKAAAKAVANTEPETKRSHGKRAEKIGIISSDKMMKTVTVRVDRLVKHPVYRKYVKRRKKFMAHDELGSKIGDKVRIVETRPLSARKRWRVVEILHRAES